MELLEREKPDFVYMEKFDKEFMKKTPEEFVQYLVENLHIKAVCVGYDYSFGYKAQGDVKLLKWFGEKYGFTDVIKLDGKIVSSTYIRSIIKAGDMEKAERFLGRRYCIEGNVVKGLQNGRKMGIPTANVDYDVNMALPEEGVYAGITYVRGKRLKCVVNVGKNRQWKVISLILTRIFTENIYA